MNSKEWLQNVSGLTHLQYFAQHKIFGDKAGSVIGVRDGYIVAIGLGKSDDKRKSAVRLLLRYASSQKPMAVAEALAAARGKFDEPIALPTSAAAVRTYSFGKPSPESVATDVDNILAALRTAAQPMQSVCEDCQRSESAITLFNDVPGHFCSGCQEKVRSELDAAAVQYEAQETNFFLGFLYGVGAALIGSVAWGGVAYLIHYIFLYGAIAIGLLVGKAVVFGMGKVTWPGRILIGVLTAGSVALGDAFFYGLEIMKTANTSLWNGLHIAVANFWKIETDSSSGVLSIVFGLIGAAIVVYNTRKPEFKARFEPLGTPTSGGSSAAGAF
jgi:hypothetical protein